MIHLDNFFIGGPGKGLHSKAKGRGDGVRGIIMYQMELSQSQSYPIQNVTHGFVTPQSSQRDKIGPRNTSQLHYNSMEPKGITDSILAHFIPPQPPLLPTKYLI